MKKNKIFILWGADVEFLNGDAEFHNEEYLRPSNADPKKNVKSPVSILLEKGWTVKSITSMGPLKAIVVLESADS